MSKIFAALFAVAIGCSGQASSRAELSPIPDIGPLDAIEAHLQSRCPRSESCSAVLLHDYEVKEQTGWATDVLPMGTSATQRCCKDVPTGLDVLVGYYEGANYPPTAVHLAIAGAADYAELLRAGAELAVPYLTSDEARSLTAAAERQRTSKVQNVVAETVGRYNLQSMYLGDDPPSLGIELSRRYDHGRTLDARCQKDDATCRTRVEHELRGLPEPK